MCDAFAISDLLEDLGLLVRTIRREQQGHRLAQNLVTSITVQPLGPFIPGLDDAVKALADYGVVRGLDNGRQQLRCSLILLELGNVAGNMRGTDNASILAVDGRDR